MRMERSAVVTPESRPQHIIKLFLATLLVTFLPLAARAAGSVLPDAGSILQQINPVEPPTPSSTGTGLEIEQGGVAELPPSAPFLVKAIQITGNTQFDTMTLHALVLAAEGQSLTLTQLNELATRITYYYHDHGYPLARAIIPAQTIQDGRVQIEVIEARYGKINLANHSRVSDALLLETLSPIQSGQVISQTLLDRSLLLLSDIPGVLSSTTLKPGEAAGTSDLEVETAFGRTVTGNVTLDDYGSRYNGRVRLGGGVNFIDPLFHGDVLSASGLSSGSGMNFGRISYDFLLNGQGVRIGGSYSAMRYILGDTLASLDGHGSAQVGSMRVKHPVMRRRDVNLYVQLEYEQKHLSDHIDVASIRTDRQLDNWTVSLSGDTRDSILSGGITTWNVSLLSGRVSFDDATARVSDAATANTQGIFSKWMANLARLQSLNKKDALYLVFACQSTNNNLDSSEKMVAGGPYTVRAYDMGAVSGDTGVLGTAELRHDLGRAWNGRWQAAAFIDAEHLTVNRNDWAAGTNDATLSGAGVRLDWEGPGQWTARTYIATPIGPKPILVAATGSIRAWVEIGKGF
jgi:hemolysin activation/secretion protein